LYIAAVAIIFQC